MKKPLFLTSVVALLCACQANDIPDSTYEYVPRNLSPETIRVIETQFLTERHRGDLTVTKVEFDETISALVITETLDSGYVWKRATQKANYARNLCEDETGFYKFVRENGIGLKFIAKDDQKRYKFGPWNQDACEHLKNQAEK